MPDYEKFYILNGQKKFVLYDDGERITFDDIPDFEGLPFYVHRYINRRGWTDWAVTCPRTGHRLGKGDTRDKAIGKAGLILSMQGREAYDFNVKRLNKEYGVPPAVPGKESK
jgi:hypothetical protein